MRSAGHVASLDLRMEGLDEKFEMVREGTVSAIGYAANASRAHVDLHKQIADLTATRSRSWRSEMSAVIRLSVAAMLLALAAFAHDHDHVDHDHGHRRLRRGEPGDAKHAARTVEVTATDTDGRMIFAPDKLDIARGEQVRFDIKNAGALEHEFVVGSKAENAEHGKMMAQMPDMKHNDPNAVTIPAGKSASLSWRFSKAGVFEFACLIPGHYESGMHGVVNVK